MKCGAKPPHSRLLFEFRADFGDDVVEICDDAEICEFKDRRVGIFVDRNDHFAVFDSRHVLRRSGNSGGDVEVRSDDFSSLADLQLIWSDAAVHGGAGGPDSTSKGISKSADDLFKSMRIFERAATGDNDLCLSEIGTATRMRAR